jgi:geranylgeranyl pyrophosphate synthase
MKKLAILKSVPVTLAALEHAFGEQGASALDPRVPPAVWWQALAGPADEFLARPGKELRAQLVHAGWLLAGGSDATLPDRLGLIVELLHAGSLVIDDVEDESAERRGGPALHHIYGVPLAINTGSWMYFWALAEIAQLGVATSAELAMYRAACTTLVRCHQGQALDLSVRVTDLALTDVANVVAATTRLKTGTLCGFATSLAAHAVGAPARIVDAACDVGVATGTALQMLDDLGSITAKARRDKGREDLRALRPTWPWAWLAETRPFAWARLVAQARAARTDDEIDAAADALAAEVGDEGRARIRSLLDDTLADLTGRAGNAPALAHIGAALSRMEKSYG